MRIVQYDDIRFLSNAFCAELRQDMDSYKSFPGQRLLKFRTPEISWTIYNIAIESFRGFVRDAIDVCDEIYKHETPLIKKTQESEKPRTQRKRK